jgi:3-isopropylmalate dehydratase small subunit
MRTILVLFLALTGFGCGYSRNTQMAMTQPGIVPVIAQLNPEFTVYS